MDYTPPKPEGSTPEAYFMKWVWDWVAKRLRIISVPNQYDVDYTPQGIKLNLKIRPGGSPPPPAQSAEISAFVITQLTGLDYFIGLKLSNFTVQSGTNFVLGQMASSPTLIAKSVPTRVLGGVEVVDGVKITYRGPPPGSTLVGYTDNNRIANDGTSDEVQVLYPRYVQYDDPTAVLIPNSSQIYSTGKDTANGLIWMGGQSVIYAIKMDAGTGVRQPTSLPNAAAVDWIELLPARVWAKRYIV